MVHYAAGLSDLSTIFVGYNALPRSAGLAPASDRDGMKGLKPLTRGTGTAKARPWRAERFVSRLASPGVRRPPVPGADVLELDFLDDEAPEKLKKLLGGEADVVLSDMAAPTTGHKATDHLRIVALAETALDFAEDVLAPGGSFACKVFQGGAEGEFLTRLKRDFTSVKHAKPKASRAESAEMYVVATGFRGRSE